MIDYENALSQLSPAQRLYAEYLLSVSESNVENIAYASNLNDYQALASLANSQGVYGTLRDPNGFVEMKNLADYYGVAVDNYGQRPLVTRMTEAQVANVTGDFPESTSSPTGVVEVGVASQVVPAETPPAPTPAATLPPALVLPASVIQGTAALKVQWYRTALLAGYTDAQIRAAVESQVGAQTDADWAYLRSAATTVASVPTTTPATTPNATTAAATAPATGVGRLLIAAAAAYYLLG